MKGYLLIFQLFILSVFCLELTSLSSVVISSPATFAEKKQKFLEAGKENLQVN